MRFHRLLGASILAASAVLAACSSPPDGGSSPLSNPGSSSGAGSGGSGGSSGNGATGTGAGSGTGAGDGGTGTGPGTGTGTDAGPPPGSPVPANTTWSDGQSIASSVIIPAGVTVAIAPGATVNVGSGVTITVLGTLTAATSATHAKLAGTGWVGMVVATGGTLSADSLDISGATTPIDVKGTATYANGTITAATTPIDVEVGGTLTMTRANVVGSVGFSKINGSFTASRLDYDSNGREGVTIADANAVVKIDNSTFHGTSNGGGDMIVSNAARSITMTYTAIQKCHCAFHFNNVTSFDLENMDLLGDSYGFMMYGSDPKTGTRVFKNSNVTTMATAGISESGTNGAISVSGVYFDTASTLQLADQQITLTSPATSALPPAMVGPQP